MMIDFEPPLIGCVVSNRNYSFDSLKSTKECVINIPTVALAAKVVQCGNATGQKVDKFKKFHFTAVPAACVQAPLIDECYANLECKVVDTQWVTKYGLFVLEVVRAWIDRSVKHPRTIHHQGNGVFAVTGRTIKLPSRKK